MTTTTNTLKIEPRVLLICIYQGQEHTVKETNENTRENLK